MGRVTRWSTALATSALMAVTGLARAQATPTTQSGGSMSSTVPDRMTAQRHLREAKQSLDMIKTSSVDQPARTGIVDLKTEFAKLERDYRANGSSGSMGTGTAGSTSGTSGSSTSAPASPETWMSDYKTVQQSLDSLIGPSPSSSSPSSSSATSGTTGTSGTVTLDPNVRRNLESFRLHMDGFAKAAGYSDTHTSASISPASGYQSGTVSATGTSGSTWSGTMATTGTSGLTTQTPSQSRVTAASGAEYYLSQIETIVDQALGTTGSSAGSVTGTSGTTGSMASSTVTIDRAKLEQIRANVEQVRKLMGGQSH
jgi:hypothetical protein